MPKSPERKRPGARRASARSRKSKRARQARWRSGLRLVWELLPLFVLVFVALAAFVLDPAALARLAWACLGGTFGLGVQLTASVVAVGGTAAVGWAFWPKPADPRRRPAKAGTAPRRQARQADGRTRSAPAAAGRGEPASPAAGAATPEPEAVAALGLDATEHARSDPAVSAPAPRGKSRRGARKAAQRAATGNRTATTLAE